jgi:hypothetical protein
MRCYKVKDNRIVIELDGPIRDRLELIIKVEDPTALSPMEQEPEVVYTGVEQEPNWMRCGPRKLTKEEIGGETIHVKGIGPEYEIKKLGGGRWSSTQRKKKVIRKDITGLWGEDSLSTS